jgi:predicted ATP-grasp superfamily ATP-dependent carboligase
MRCTGWRSKVVSRKVLVTHGGSGQSRGTVSTVRALASDGWKPTVTVSGSLSMAAASRFCSARIKVPYAGTDGYPEAVMEEYESGSYAALIPTSDVALVALKFPVRHLMDKVECARAAVAAGLSVPPSQTFGSRGELLAAASELEYPVVIKPALKRYAATRVDSPGQLPKALKEEGPVIVQPYLSDKLRAVVGLMWDGEMRAAVHLDYVRVWPMPCGTTASAVTVPPDEKTEAGLLKLLSGYNGIFHAEFAGDYLLDLNPRVHGTLPLALGAGVNLPALYCRVTTGGSIPAVRGEPGRFFRWMEGDFRSVLTNVRQGRMDPRAALRAVRPHRGTIHSYESLSDPGPMLARLAFALRRPWPGRKKAPPPV